MKAAQEIIKDIVWCLQSKDILHPSYTLPSFSPIFYSELLNTLQPRIKYWKENPNYITNNFQNKNIKLLGCYFEELIHFIFKEHPEYNVITFQEQIIEDKITKGELDLIVQNRNTGIKIHIEVAIKYYLAETKSIDNKTLWWGPNHNDRLDLKLNKIKNKQLPMIQESTYAHEEIQSYTIIKGGLFVPVGAELCKGIHPVLGQWIKYSDFKVLYQSQPFPYIILSKKEWLSDLDNDEYEGKEIYQTMPVTKTYTFLIKNTITNKLLFIVTD